MAFDQRRITTVFAAFSFLCIGVVQLYAEQVLIGRPPFSEAGWNGTWIAWTTGVLLITCGVLAIMQKSASIFFSIVTAAFVVFYCALPNFWLVINGDMGMALTGFGKGISLATGLLVLAVAVPAQEETGSTKVILQACHYALGIFLMASGIQHFLFAPFVVTLIPTWIPFREFWTHATGALLVINGLCLITGFKLRVALAFVGLMIFSWVLTIHMPRAFFTVRDINEWTSLFEAIAFASLLLLLSRASINRPKSSWS